MILQEQRDLKAVVFDQLVLATSARARGFVNCRIIDCDRPNRREENFWGAQLCRNIPVCIYEDARNPKTGRSSFLLPRLRNSPPFRRREIGEGLPFPIAANSACESSNPLLAADILMAWTKRVRPLRNFHRARSSSLDKCRGWLRSVRKPKT